jgi:hypothetical protein
VPSSWFVRRCKSCLNVPKRVREVMLNDYAKGKKRRADYKEHKLVVDKAIMDLAYIDARREQIPRDEDGKIA